MSLFTDAKSDHVTASSSSKEVIWDQHKRAKSYQVGEGKKGGHAEILDEARDNRAKGVMIIIRLLI